MKVLLLLLLLYLLCACSGRHQSDCPIRQVCLGHMNSTSGEAIGSSVTEVLQILHRDFCGCRTVDGNIEVIMEADFPNLDNVSLTGANFTFFSEITEVTGYIYIRGMPSLTLLSFPRLRLIRGRQTFISQFALAIEISSITRLYMPRLTEITNGNVIFAHNTPPLCSSASVNWADIINSGTYTGPTNSTCTRQNQAPKCNNCTSGYCWCDGNQDECCQTLSKTVCLSCSNRCAGSSGGLIQCCNTDCAAGCTGGNEDQCHACRNLNNNGVCVSACPPEFIIIGGAIVPNPDFRVQAATQCIVPPSPEGTPAPLVITLLNGSPRVSGDSVTAEFSTNKNVTMMQCRLGRGVTEFEDCASGNVNYSGLGRKGVEEFVLHIQARTATGETANIRRIFRIERPQHCSVHLVNSGNMVIGNDVIAEFNGTGPISHYTCFLNGRVFMERCTSPVTFPNLRSPGRHVFKVTPFGCGINRSPVTFYADIGNVMIEICRVSMTQPIAVQGNSATLHFMGSGPYQSFTCFVDRGGAVYRNCNSPFVVSNLTAGKHFIKIRPDGPGCIPWPNRRPLRVDFSIE